MFSTLLVMAMVYLFLSIQGLRLICFSLGRIQHLSYLVTGLYRSLFFYKIEQFLSFFLQIANDVFAAFMHLVW